MALCWKISNGVVGNSFHVSNGTFRWTIYFSNEKYTFIVFGHWLEVFCNSHDEKSVVLSKLISTCPKTSYREKRFGENVLFKDFRKLSGKILAFCRRILRSCQNFLLLVQRYSFAEKYSPGTTLLSQYRRMSVKYRGFKRTFLVVFRKVFSKLPKWPVLEKIQEKGCFLTFEQW